MADEAYFVEVDIETDGQQLADEAVERLQVQWTDWEPNEGDLEVVQIETLAPMAENAAEAAALVPPAVLRAYGEKLIGRPYDSGEQATTTLTFTASDSLGHIIPAGTEIDIDGFAFTVDVDTEIFVGSTAVSGVAVHAAEETTEANDLVGTSVTPVTALSYLESVTVDTPTAGGTDAETDEDYQNGLSGDLLLQAKTLVTTRDFELWALAKSGVGRTAAVHTGDRAVTVVLATPEGEVVPTPIKDELLDEFTEFRLVNTVLTMADPTYTTISVTYGVKALPGYDFADLESRIDTMLTELLDPAVWGTPKTGEAGVTPNWLNDPVVRAYFLVDRIADVEGVAYVTSIAIAGSAGSASGSDWTMAGSYALPRAGTMTGTVT